MKQKRRTSFHAALLVLATLSACGIDQGDAVPPPPDDPLPTAQTTYGPITGFGSILVNGLTVDVSEALVLVDGFPATEADLNVGQIVRVLSLVENNEISAFLVEYQENAVGPIQNLDVGNGTFTVLDQQIQTDTDTAQQHSAIWQTTTWYRSVHSAIRPTCCVPVTSAMLRSPIYSKSAPRLPRSILPQLRSSWVR